jgi:hypothetical protein
VVAAAVLRAVLVVLAHLTITEYREDLVLLEMWPEQLALAAEEAAEYW